ncbi:hypothetical protein Bhyg_10097, partial [Pseudolycoriella hygida]
IRQSETLAYPHDVYRRFKEDDYLALDERFSKVEQTCNKRLKFSKKGLYEAKNDVANIVEKQMLENNLELENLHKTGNALLTNIRIACERRQLQRRENEKAAT